MADGVAVTPSTATSRQTIDTDEVTRGGQTVQQQIVKLSLGADGVCDMLVAAGPQAAANSIPVVLASDQTALTVSGTVTATVAGTVDVTGSTVTANLAAGTNNIGDVDVLTLPSGSIAAGATGTAGTASSAVVSVQGVASMTAVQIDTRRINGAAIDVGAGASGTGTTRFAIATDGQGQVADNAAFTDGTTRLDLAGYVFDEVAGTALTENDAAAARIDSKRAQIQVLEDATTRGQRAAISSAGALAVNPTQIGGNSISTGNGTSGTGVQRVTIASDSTGQVALAAGSATIGALTANQSVNVSQMNGVTVTMGAGAAGTGVQRVAIATDGQGQLADNAAFTDGTTRLDMAGYIFDETAGTALTENDGAAARVDSKRAQVMVFEDATTRGQRAAVSSAGALAVNQAQIAGNTTAAGNGVSGTGVQRVTIASDSTGQVAITPSTTATQTQVADSATDVTILASNSSRKGASIANTSTANLFLRTGTTAATTSNYTVKLVPDAYYEVPAGYTGAIHGIWATDPNTGNANVTEYS